MDEKEKAFVQEIITETIRQLKRNGMLRDPATMAYQEASDILRRYFKNGESDPETRKVIETFEDDPYYKILPLYFGYGYTIEEVAEAFEVEVSTISRNKKRLSLAIFDKLE